MKCGEGIILVLFILSFIHYPSPSHRHKLWGYNSRPLYVGVCVCVCVCVYMRACVCGWLAAAHIILKWLKAIPDMYCSNTIILDFFHFCVSSSISILLFIPSTLSPTLLLIVFSTRNWPRSYGMAESVFCKCYVYEHVTSCISLVNCIISVSFAVRYRQRKKLSCLVIIVIIIDNIYVIT